MPAGNGTTRVGPSIALPNISPAELLAFHTSHFSSEALGHFGQTFLSPGAAAAAAALHLDDPHHSRACEEWDWQGDEVEDDDLGYYDDGVKRTLTDEQIEIFRHSELRELRRERERLAQAGKTATSSDQSADDSNKADLQASVSGSTDLQSSKKKRKKKVVPRKEPKPDLRKRTWDVVGAGLDSLDYD